MRKVRWVFLAFVAYSHSCFSVLSICLSKFRAFLSQPFRAYERARISEQRVIIASSDAPKGLCIAPNYQRVHNLSTSLIVFDSFYWDIYATHVPVSSSIVRLWCEGRSAISPSFWLYAINESISRDSVIMLVNNRYWLVESSQKCTGLVAKFSIIAFSINSRLYAFVFHLNKLIDNGFPSVYNIVDSSHSYGILSHTIINEICILLCGCPWMSLPIWPTMGWRTNRLARLALKQTIHWRNHYRFYYLIQRMMQRVWVKYFPVTHSINVVLPGWTNKIWKETFFIYPSTGSIQVISHWQF